MRRTLRVLVPLAVAAWLAAPTAVVAHAELRTADPAPNATLEAPPAEFELTFTEPIDAGNFLYALTVRDTGAAVALAEPAFTDADSRVTIPSPALDAGVYVVVYRAVSAADGHVIEGRYAFQIDPTGTAPPLAEEAVSAAPNAGLAPVVARGIALAAALVVVGTASFWLFAARPALRAAGERSSRKTPWAMIAVAAFTTFAALGAFLTLASAGLGTTSSGPHEHFALDFAGPFGWTAFAIAMRVVEVASLVCVLVAGAWLVSPADLRRLASVVRVRSLAAGQRWNAEVVTLAAVLVIGSVALAGFSFAGHAAASGGVVGAAVDFLHLAAVAVWVGSLPALILFTALHARRAPPGERRALALAGLRRHSRIALVAGPAVALTGIANSPLVLGSTRDLVTTDYGNVLLAKAVVFSAAIGLGAANFFLLRANRPWGVARVAAAEVGLGALAVLLASGLATLQPPNGPAAAARAAAVQPVHLTAHSDAGVLHAVVTPSTGRLHFVDVAVLDDRTGAYIEDVDGISLTVHSAGERDTAQPPVEAAASERQAGLFGAQVSAPATGAGWLLGAGVTRGGVVHPVATFEVPALAPAAPVSATPSSALLGPLRALTGAIPAMAAVAVSASALLVAAVAVAVRSRRRRSGLRGGGLRAVQAGAVALGVAAALVAGTHVFVRQASAAPAEARAATNPVAPDSGSIERGTQAYLANCAACHADGEALGEAVAGRTDGELHHLIENGIPGTEMPAFAVELSDMDRWDVVNYLRHGLAH